ncbi:MAG: DUF1284 domain-containing protein [Alphaproteobacteria bacterium]|nr:DUF1284 domain-containing protein [Rhizobiaceae bacterium]MBU3959804.1 DUF1284 domain-containing protein [Alphaproteobacteria bacterium]MBU4050883.1 DUF1284 domain-containing protein [Alphaproteobacteria bacterium]MBU4087606.1 DUF1284 domain-containing protein [Alphaproteobacteria bacterium]MBU4155604.1 DUF1284 domain-containing protein [Alphaproteobacteria bacterium]
MTVRLRAHHLLCMLTYVGKGYSPAFVENYEAIAARLSAGEEIELVAGPDDICGPLAGDPDAHCHGESVVGRDQAATEAVARLLGSPLFPGARITPGASLLARLRKTFATGEIRTACSGCEWSDLCDGVADGGYAGARVAP